jgi:Lrp/AsnC family leucine-responsive transcriptional regulator
MREDKLLNDIDRQILKILQVNARISFSELGRMVNLSSQLVTERVRRMEKAGYIKRYIAVANHEKLGLPITVFISVAIDVGKIKEADEAICQIPEITEAHHLSGEYGLMLKVMVASIKHLESVIDKVSDWGKATSSIVLSSSITSRAPANLTMVRDVQS